MNTDPNQAHSFSNDILLSTIVTLSIFVLGIIVNIMTKYFAERKRLNNVKKFLKFGLTKLIVAAKDQIDNLNKTSSEIGNSKHYHFVLRDNVNFNNKSLDSISSLDLHKIIFRINTKIDHSEILDVLLNTIDFVANHRKNYVTNFQLFYSKYIEYEKRWNEKVDELRKMFDQVIIRSSEGTVSELNKKLISIYSSFRKDAPNNDMDTKNELFVDKIIAVCKNYISDSTAINIGQLAVSCSNIFTYILEQRKIYSDQMLNEKETLEQRIKLLDKIVSLL